MLPKQLATAGRLGFSSVCSGYSSYLTRMLPASPPQQLGPRGSSTKLHKAARDGSVERILSLLSEGSFDIDQDTPQVTPLICAVMPGHSRAVKILLSKGANPSIPGAMGAPLHVAALGGHLAITKMLVKAGADLEARNPLDGSTPLHFAAGEGRLEIVNVLIKAGANPESRSFDGSTPLHPAAQAGRLEVMEVLIEAGANPNSRTLKGFSPLYDAAQLGQVGAMKMLLRAGSDPLLPVVNDAGMPFIVLDHGADCGQLAVVRELIQGLGIEGCGGASGGADALRAAATNQHVDIMRVLADAGVADTGRDALALAAALGREQSVKFLLQQQVDGETQNVDFYLNSRDEMGSTPLAYALDPCSSPRVVRLLVDAGADTTSAVRFPTSAGFDETPLAFITRWPRTEKTRGGIDSTEQRLHRLEGIRRVLLRVEAAHALSWLWHNDDLSTANAAAEDTSNARMTPTALGMVMPSWRRQARGHGVLQAALLRCGVLPSI